MGTQYIKEGLKGWKKFLPLINVTLFLGVIALGIIGTSLFRRAIPSPLTGLERLKTKTPPQQVSVPTIQTNAALQEAYDLLTNENPFAPSRKEWEPLLSKRERDAQKQAEPEAPPPKVPPKKLIVYGIAISENLKKALVKNPDPAIYGVAPFLHIEEGNDVGGYKVKSIEPNLLRLIWEGQEFVVDVFADKENVKTLPSPPGAPPYTPPPPPRPEARNIPQHERDLPSRRPSQRRTDEEFIEEEEEEEEWDEEEEEWDEEEEEDYERDRPPKRSFQKSRRR